MRATVITLTVWCVMSVAYGQNVSNILKLSKPQKVLSIKVDTPNFNVTDDFTDKNDTFKERSGVPLISFSKNNPELDWKNHLKNVDKIEKDSPRDLNLDFMKDKLEKTANSVQWLTDLYDPLRWIRVPGKLQPTCRRDMDWFLKALKDGKLWAAKSKLNPCHFIFSRVNTCNRNNFKILSHITLCHPVHIRHWGRFFLLFPTGLRNFLGCNSDEFSNECKRTPRQKWNLYDKYCSETKLHLQINIIAHLLRYQTWANSHFISYVLAYVFLSQLAGL